MSFLTRGSGNDVIIQGNIGSGGHNGTAGSPGGPNLNPDSLGSNPPEPGAGGAGGLGGVARYIVDAGDGLLHNNVFTPVNTNNDMIVVGKAGLYFLMMQDPIVISMPTMGMIRLLCKMYRPT